VDGGGSAATPGAGSLDGRSSLDREIDLVLAQQDVGQAPPHAAAGPAPGWFGFCAGASGGGAAEGAGRDASSDDEGAGGAAGDQQERLEVGAL
jgi:hypothetical protein